MQKVFIVSLPRTGTTSVCAASLNMGFKVAHTAFSKASIALADVIADAPVFFDFPYLDDAFPEARFIYIDRPAPSWVLSAKPLLRRIMPRLQKGTPVYNPILLRAYLGIFRTLDPALLESDDYLISCHEAHRRAVLAYFKARKNDLFIMDLSDPDSFLTLLSGQHHALPANTRIPHLNKQGKINDWQQMRHPNKVDPFLYGKDRRRYYSFPTGDDHIYTQLRQP